MPADAFAAHGRQWVIPNRNHQRARCPDRRRLVGWRHTATRKTISTVSLPDARCLSAMSGSPADMSSPRKPLLTLRRRYSHRRHLRAGNIRTGQFHFVTLELQIEAPAEAVFVNHSERYNYHREVLADPAALIRPDPDLAYWTESNDTTRTLRIRDDETALLSSEGNGRTYYVGVAGVGADTEPLRFTAVAAGSLVRESTCHLVIDEMPLGDRIPGYFG